MFSPCKFWRFATYRHGRRSDCCFFDRRGIWQDHLKRRPSEATSTVPPTPWRLREKMLQCWQCWCVVHLVDFWRAGGLRGERHAARSCSDGEGMDFHWCCELMQGGSAAFVLTENHVCSWSFHIVARLTVWDSGRRRTQGMQLLQWLACWDFSIETIKLIPPSDGHCSNVSISTCSLFSRLNNIMFICLRQLDLPGNWVIHRMSPS